MKMENIEDVVRVLDEEIQTLEVRLSRLRTARVLLDGEIPADASGIATGILQAAITTDETAEKLTFAWQQIPSTPEPEPTPEPAKKPHPLTGQKKSPEAIENMKKAQQLRIKAKAAAAKREARAAAKAAAAEPPAKVVPAKSHKKRVLTPEGRQSIIENNKRRHAALKAARAAQG